jgi:photosystem II stability/assembly factor-like uncharacterized protein
MLRRAPLAAVAALAALAGVAEANGRFPSSGSVSFRPQNQLDIFLGVTFGLLVSHDDGASFYWVCEQNIGYEGTFDPKYRIGVNGDIYATTFEGLRVSRDGGCSFTTATAGQLPTSPGYLDGVWVDAIDTGPDESVWVATAEAGRPNDVYRSTDHAQTFTPLGLSSTTVWWKSVAVAPSNAQRAYVTGYQVTQTGPDGGSIPPTVHLYRTDDAGANWTMLGIGAFTLGTSPLLLVEEVAADDPQLVFVRSVRAVLPQGDKLYRSTDGGETFTEVLTTTDTIRNVVMRADDSVFVATQMGGIHKSVDSGQTFQKISDMPQAACLGDRGDTLFACGANWEPDFFAIGRSADGSSWSRVFRYVEMKGPVACPVGTMQRDTCEALLWPSVAETFGIVQPGAEDVPRDPPGGCCNAQAAPVTPAIGGLLIALGLVVRRRKRA